MPVNLCRLFIVATLCVTTAVGQPLGDASQREDQASLSQAWNTLLRELQTLAQGLGLHDPGMRDPGAEIPTVAPAASPAADAAAAAAAGFEAVAAAGRPPTSPPKNAPAPEVPPRPSKPLIGLQHISLLVAEDLLRAMSRAWQQQQPSHERQQLQPLRQGDPLLGGVGGVIQQGPEGPQSGGVFVRQQDVQEVSPAQEPQPAEEPQTRGAADAEEPQTGERQPRRFAEDGSWEGADTEGGAADDDGAVGGDGGSGGDGGGGGAGRRLLQAAAGPAANTMYANAFRLVFGNFFDLVDGARRYIATLAAEASQLLTNVHWIRDLAYLATAPLDNIINSNTLPLPKSIDQLRSLFLTAVNDYCTPELVVPPQLRLGEFTGPTFLLALTPASCPVAADPDSGRRSIDWAACVPARLTVTLTVGTYNSRYWSAPVYTGRTCRYSRAYGTDTTYRYGGGRSTYTIRTSARQLDIVPVLNQFFLRGRFSRFVADNLNFGNVTGGPIANASFNATPTTASGTTTAFVFRSAAEAAQADAADPPGGSTPTWAAVRGDTPQPYVKAVRQAGADAGRPANAGTYPAGGRTNNSNSSRGSSSGPSGSSGGSKWGAGTATRPPFTVQRSPSQGRPPPVRALRPLPRPRRSPAAPTAPPEAEPSMRPPPRGGRFAPAPASKPSANADQPAFNPPFRPKPSGVLRSVEDSGKPGGGGSSSSGSGSRDLAQPPPPKARPAPSERSLHPPQPASGSPTPAYDDDVLVYKSGGTTQQPSAPSPKPSASAAKLSGLGGNQHSSSGSGSDGSGQSVASSNAAAAARLQPAAADAAAATRRQPTAAAAGRGAAPLSWSRAAGGSSSGQASDPWVGGAQLEDDVQLYRRGATSPSQQQQQARPHSSPARSFAGDTGGDTGGGSRAVPTDEEVLTYRAASHLPPPLARRQEQQQQQHNNSAAAVAAEQGRLASPSGQLAGGVDAPSVPTTAKRQADEVLLLYRAGSFQRSPATLLAGQESGSLPPSPPPAPAPPVASFTRSSRTARSGIPYRPAGSKAAQHGSEYGGGGGGDAVPYTRGSATADRRGTGGTPPPSVSSRNSGGTVRGKADKSSSSNSGGGGDVPARPFKSSGQQAVTAAGSGSLGSGPGAVRLGLEGGCGTALPKRSPEQSYSDWLLGTLDALLADGD